MMSTWGGLGPVIPAALIRFQAGGDPGRARTTGRLSRGASGPREMPHSLTRMAEWAEDGQP